MGCAHRTGAGTPGTTLNGFPERRPSAMTVLAIAVTPNTTGLPGITEFTNIVGAMMTVGALACVLAVILSAGMWALGSHSGNVQLTSRAKTGVVVSAVAALLIGGAPLPGA